MLDLDTARLNLEDLAWGLARLPWWLLRATADGMARLWIARDAREARVTRRELAGANHTFSRRVWRDAVAGWTLEWLRTW